MIQGLDLENNDRKAYYESLNLTPQASPEEIKKNYRSLALTYHPDKNPEGGEKVSVLARHNLTSQMRQISHAYSVLSDETKKRIYDDYGQNGLQWSEQIEKDSSMADAIQKAWIYGGAGLGVILIIDYFLSFPLEWIITLFLTFGGIYIIPENLQRAGALFGLLVVDLFFYLIIPTDWVHFVAHVLLMTSLIGIQNVVISSFDLSIVVWLGSTLLSYPLQFSPERFITSLLGVHCISLCLLTLFLIILWSQVQYIKHPPSKLLPYLTPLFHFISRIFSGIAFVIGLYYVVMWAIDYWTGIPLEWLIFCLMLGISAIAHRDKINFLLFIPLLLLTGTLYYFLHPHVLAHTSNITLSMLTIFYAYTQEFSFRENPSLYTDQEADPMQPEINDGSDVPNQHGGVKHDSAVDANTPIPSPDLATGGLAPEPVDPPPKLIIDTSFRISYVLLFIFLIYGDFYLREAPESCLIFGALCTACAIGFTCSSLLAAFKSK